MFDQHMHKVLMMQQNSCGYIETLNIRKRILTKINAYKIFQ